MDEPDMQYTQDLGLSRHEWESEWASLEPLLADAPEETLPDLDDLVTRMLEERGIPTDPVGAEGVEPELVAEYREAHRIARLVADGGDADPGDVGAAVRGFRTIYESLLGGMGEPPGA